MTNLGKFISVKNAILVGGIYPKRQFAFTAFTFGDVSMKSNPSPKARFAVHDGAVWLSTPYNAIFVLGLKVIVPSRARRWHAQRRLWEIHIRWRNQVLEYTAQFWDLERACYEDLAVSAQVAA